MPTEADVDTVWARAVEAGATRGWKPERTERNDRCRVRDPEGYAFGIHEPGAPRTW
ncbi:hypothetical protein [Actinophytocola sp.]|uniref:hypothetical protein n=1 Tax=Actinophytocola sp. TaxID=1872138 RepID=UPI0025BE607C|nr:hypothetical protein [Actinophytocola sp.]